MKRVFVITQEDIDRLPAQLRTPEVFAFIETLLAQDTVLEQLLDIEVVRGKSLPTTGPVAPSGCLVAPTTPAAPPDYPTQTLWSAYAAPTYAGHGYAGENEYRTKAHENARAMGFDCIRFTLKSVPNPELSIHLFWYESDKDKGKFLGTWYKAATAAGITRWQIELACDDYVTAYDRFKAYPKGSVQWVTNQPFTAEIMAVLHCDANGVKNTEPEYRQ